MPVAILVLLLVVVAVGGVALFGVAWWLRREKLHPEGDRIEGEPEPQRRPEHVRVENEQHARFVGDG